jgi:hypothetical protein
MVACKPMWQNMQAYQTIANSACTDINAELLLAPVLEYTMRIVLCSLVLFVKIYDAVSTKTCLI